MNTREMEMGHAFVRTASLLAIITATLVLPGCVTHGRYDRVVAERDSLARDKQVLQRRGAELTSVAAIRDRIPAG